MTKKKSVFKKSLAVLAILALTLYVLNLTFGIVEILPDNLPIVGNLDEASAGALIIALIKYVFNK